VPGVTDLQPPVCRIDVEITRAADDLAARGLAHDKRHRAVLLAHVERRRDVLTHLLAGGDRRVPQPPQRTVGCGAAERIFVFPGERLERRMDAEQPYRFNERHGTPCGQRPARAMNTTRSNRWTSCSFLSSAPCSGGMYALRSPLFSASGGMSSASSNLSQSRSSEVDGFFLRPGTSRKLKNTSSASASSAFLSPGK